MRFLSVILFLHLLPLAIYAQVEVESGFLKNKITLGEPVEIYVKSIHPADFGIVYPDSNGNFEPFEYIHRKYYPTITKNGISRDCTVYQLRLFKLVTFPKLAIPVYSIENQDTAMFFSEPASIKLKELITSLEDFPELKEDNILIEIPKSYNYPLLVLGIVILLILLALSIRYLGKPILIRYKIFTTIQNHRSFTLQFDKLELLYQSKRDVLVLENLLSVWKEYLTELEDRPISSYTSTEILQYFNREELQTSLRNIDHTIFGGLKSKKVLDDIKTLKKFTNSRYIHQKNEIRKG
jgi:hypothetical protein